MCSCSCVYLLCSKERSNSLLFPFITLLLINPSPPLYLFFLCFPDYSENSSFHSKLQTYFQWDCTAPFQLSPEQGLLKPGQQCHITVVFRPQEALVYQQQAYCWFGEEEDKAESCCTVLLQGLGTATETGQNFKIKKSQIWIQIR